MIASFQDASRYITVDERKIAVALRFVLDQQDQIEGWWREPGNVHSSYLKVARGKN